MPSVQEISEEAESALQIIEHDSDYEDTDEELEFEEDIANETLGDRFIALKDMISPRQRKAIIHTSTTLKTLMGSVFKFAGKTTYVVATSALLLGVPLALAIVDEQQVVAMEREMKMQQGANEVLAPGASSPFANQKPF